MTKPSLSRGYEREGMVKALSRTDRQATSERPGRPGGPFPIQDDTRCACGRNQGGTVEHIRFAPGTQGRSVFYSFSPARTPALALYYF